jgi:hypothetical protein
MFSVTYIAEDFSIKTQYFNTAVEAESFTFTSEVGVVIEIVEPV